MRAIQLTLHHYLYLHTSNIRLKLLVGGIGHIPQQSPSYVDYH